MDTCLSSNHSPEAVEKPKINAEKTATQFLIFPLSSPPFFFIHSSPFSRQPLKPNSRFLMETSKVVREVQQFVAFNVDNCFKMVDNLRSQNGVLDKVLSFCACVQNGRQLPRMKRWNMAVPSNSNFAAILPGDSLAGVAVTNGISNFLNIYNTVLVLRLVLTWFPNAPPAIVNPLSTICDPYLNLFRGIIPPQGGLDFSPILAFLVLDAFTSSAAALPAELPPAEGSIGIENPKMSFRITSSHKKWMMRRFSGSKSTSSNCEV
ncbi:YGGT family protein [Striga hermonthica]|uniref:YGGT family protein n=1 Tax=Striga hermonthica TaxID=68872 RepID=A0A9N7RNY1_STRHE|nr:YGGT family protein [Striga hermonthica]